LSKLVLEEELDFEPGSQYQYSNGGYAILAEIIEKASGRTYQEYLNENIFKTLNMSSTGHNKGNDVIPNRAVSLSGKWQIFLSCNEFCHLYIILGSLNIDQRLRLFFN
jgi:CubicO group peptidase (beta-lactamase class C family)